MLSSHPPSSSVPKGTAPWMVTQPSPVRQMCRQSGTASPLGPLFPVSPRESSLHRPVADGTAAQARWMSRGEHSGRQMRHNKPVLGISSVLTAKTTQSRRLFQALSVPHGRVTQAAIPRTASFPGGSLQGQKRRHRHGRGFAMCDGKRGRHPSCQQQTACCCCSTRIPTPALPCQPNSSMLRLVVLDLGRPRFHIYQFPLPYG